MSEGGEVLTVGHSIHAVEDFLQLLSSNGVTAVADVRSVPASRFNPQYNRDPLTASLRRLGIDYVFLGRELGARSDDPKNYVDGKVQYARLASGRSYEHGIERVMKGCQSHRIAVMCSEGDPLDCHRMVLVAETLRSRGVHVAHMLPDGSMESHDAALSRLRRLHGMEEADLLHSVADLTAEALRRQELKIAYADPDTQELSKG